jgi:hypothetical protein
MGAVCQFRLFALTQGRFSKSSLVELSRLGHMRSRAKVRGGVDHGVLETRSGVFLPSSLTLQPTRPNIPAQWQPSTNFQLRP